MGTRCPHSVASRHCGFAKVFEISNLQLCTLTAPECHRPIPRRSPWSWKAYKKQGREESPSPLDSELSERGEDTCYLTTASPCVRASTLRWHLSKSQMQAGRRRQR